MNQDLVDYILHLADNALVLGHQNSKWCGHGPVLEQDIAITNISLDLVGQARNFYQYAARVVNLADNKIDPATEDSLAYLRDTREFKNFLLLEQPNGDWARTILRQFLFTTYQYFLYRQLQNSKDTQLAAIAEKSLKEVTYHLRWSSEWMIRLGDGTEYSHQRMIDAIENLWMYTGELFFASRYESWAIKNQIAVDLDSLRISWEEKVKDIFNEATLIYPGKTFMQTGGKEGKHTEHLGFILSDLQFMQRAYPGCEW